MRWRAIPLGAELIELRPDAPADHDLIRRLALLATELRRDPAVRDAFNVFGVLALAAAPPIDGQRWCERVAEISATLPAALPPPRRHSIPVTYDGPDLQDHAAACGLSVIDLIARHTAPDYLIAAIGFRPHFPYLLGLDPTLARPRRSEPRVRVPAGSVGIGGDQTGIYPQSSPGGWHLLGRCDPQCCQDLASGDLLRFVAEDDR